MISKFFINTIRFTWTSARLFSQVLHPTPIRFETFSRQVQKATAVSEVISIYQQQPERSGNSQYLAITLRLLTRIIRKGQQEDYEKIQQFLKESFEVMKTLDLSQLKAVEMKDFLLFFLHYVEESQTILSSERQLFQAYLKRFLSLYQTSDKKTRVQYLPVFTSCVRLAHRCINNMIGQFLTEIQKEIEENSSLFIRDSLTFLSLLKISQVTFVPYNNSFLSFSVGLMKNILKADSSQFTMSASIQILITALKIKKASLFCLSKLEISQVDDVISITESQIRNSIMKACQRDIQALVNNLLEVDPDSSLLKDVFEIVVKSVGTKGECSINPLIVLWYLPLLKQQHLYLLQNKWEDRFILLLRKYFDNRQFTRTIDSQLRTIIKNRLFSSVANHQIYRFYLKYHQNTQKIALFCSELQNAELHALQLEEQALSKSIERIQLWVRQIQSNWPKQAKKYLWMNSFQQSQPSSPQILSLGKIQYTAFVNEISAKIFLTKIKVLYLQNQHKKVSQLLLNTGQNSSLPQKVKLELIRGLLLEVNLASHHIPLAIGWLQSLFEGNDPTELQRCVLKVLFDYFKESNASLDKYAVDQVWEFAKPRLNWIYKLLFLNPRLLNIMVYYKYSEIEELTFRWIYTKHNLLYKYKPVIFSLLCRYAQLPSDEAIMFWKKLSNVVRNMPIEFLQITAGFLIKSNISHLPIVQNTFRTICSSSRSVSQQKPNISLMNLNKTYLNSLSEGERTLFELIELSDLDLLNRLDKIQMEVLTYKKNEEWVLLCSRLLRRMQKAKYSFKKPNKFIENLILQFATTGSRLQTSSALKAEVLRFFIENGIYCSALKIDNFAKIHISSSSNPNQIIRYVYQYPTAKHQFFMLENIDHLCRLTSFNEIVFLFALTDRPSASLVNWVKRWATDKQLPIFFQVYLQYLHPEIHKQLVKTNQLDKNMTPQIFLQSLFPEKNIDFVNIQTKQSIEGCQKLITRKILKAANPRLKVSFGQTEDKPKISFFKRQ